MRGSSVAVTSGEWLGSAAGCGAGGGYGEGYGFGSGLPTLFARAGATALAWIGCYIYLVVPGLVSVDRGTGADAARAVRLPLYVLLRFAHTAASHVPFAGRYVTLFLLALDAGNCVAATERCPQLAQPATDPSTCKKLPYCTPG